MNKSNQIRTLNVRDALRLMDSGEVKAEEVYLVTLSERLKGEFESRGATYVKSLGPTSRLWKVVQEMKTKGIWDSSQFDTYYRNEYLTSLMDRPSSLSYLELLTNKFNNGEDIILVCFCQNPVICHRTILEEVLIKMTSKDVINK